MATALEHSEENKSMTLACVLCRDESKKPKLLPCQHSCCTQCLIQHQETLDEGKPFCCPTCHKDIELRDDAVESLPDNYVYDIVKEAYGGIRSSEIKCMSCRQIENVTNATHKCLDCGDTLCKHCNEWHCRTSMTKHHAVVPLEDFKKETIKEELSTRKMINCSLHSTEEQNIPLSIYCDNCESLVCVTCTHSDHKGHEFTELLDARKKRKNPARDEFQRLQRSEKDQLKRVKNIENCISSTEQTWNEQETEMYDKATEMYAMVDKIKVEKLAELKIHYEEELQQLNDILDEEKYKLSSQQASVAFSQAFLEHSSVADFLYHEKDVRSRMEPSRKSRDNIFTRNACRIEKDRVETLMPSMKSVFGRIVATKTISHHKCRIGEVKTVFSKKVEMLEIYGIGLNADTRELFLSGKSCNESLLVLNYNGTFKRYVKCANANKSFDICIKKNKIYVTFYSPLQQRLLGVIHEIGTQVVRQDTMLPKDDQDSNFEVTVVVNEDNIILVSSDKTHRIYKMHPGENTLTTFLSKENGSSVHCPSYMCVTPSGDWVVSNRSSSSLQVYSEEGELLWQYDGKKEVNALSTPSGICCDEEGYIYVADHENCRIQVIRNNELIGNVSIDIEAKDFTFVPIEMTPEGDLIYGYGDNLVRISFWE